jgi:formate hydrogenlyase subunit 3/multisubunit Na+/H+ antiporter MnhD subunit
MNIPETQLGLLLIQVPILPLAGAATLWGGAWCGLRTAGKSIALLAAGLSLMSIVAALVLPGAGEAPRTLIGGRWLELGAGSGINISLHWDGLGALWLIVQTVAALLVLSCVKEGEEVDAGARSTAAWSLALLGLLDLLALSGNYWQLFVCWELSLVAAWRLLATAATNEADVRAAQRMLWTGLIGDLPLLVGLLAIWQAFGTFEFAAVLPAASTAATPDSPLDVMRGFAAFCLVIAALVRCAQFPACNWLPLAAGTRATPALWGTLIGVLPAGVFLLLRSAPLLAANPAAMSLLVNWGCLSAAVWGCLALTQPDARRALAAFVAGAFGLACAGVGASGGTDLAPAAYLACNLLVLPAALLCGFSIVARAGDRGAGWSMTLVLAIVLASGVWGQEAVLGDLWTPGANSAAPLDAPPADARVTSPAPPLAALLAHLLLSLGLFRILLRRDQALVHRDGDAPDTPHGGRFRLGGLVAIALLLVPCLFGWRWLSGQETAGAEANVRLAMPGMTGLAMILALLIAWLARSPSRATAPSSETALASLARLSRRGFYVDEAFRICCGLPLAVCANVFRFLELHVWEWELLSGDDGAGPASDADADPAVEGRSLMPVLALFAAAGAVLAILLLED